MLSRTSVLDREIDVRNNKTGGSDGLSFSSMESQG